jgi:hypothetical protein
MFAAAFILRMRFKAMRGPTDIGTIFYEAQPYLYLGLGLYAIFNLRNAKLAVGLGLMLLFCATVIIQWRAQRHKK